VHIRHFRRERKETTLGNEVVPAASRKNHNSFIDAAALCADRAKQLADLKLPSGALGILGDQSGFTDAYNDSVERIRATLQQSAARLAAVGDALENVADDPDDPPEPPTADDR